MASSTVTMRKKFRIKKRPSKPVRQKSRPYEESIGYESLQSVIDTAKLWGAPFNECEIEFDGGYGGYYDDSSVYLRWNGTESDEIFQHKVEEYERKLKLYEEWVVEFKDEIAEETRKKISESLRKQRGY